MASALVLVASDTSGFGGTTVFFGLRAELPAFATAAGFALAASAVRSLVTAAGEAERVLAPRREAAETAGTMKKEIRKQAARKRLPILKSSLQLLRLGSSGDALCGWCNFPDLVDRLELFAALALRPILPDNALRKKGSFWRFLAEAPAKPLSRPFQCIAIGNKGSPIGGMFLSPEPCPLSSFF
jgi:hypothetical protein